MHLCIDRKRPTQPAALLFVDELRQPTRQIATADHRQIIDKDQIVRLLLFHKTDEVLIPVAIIDHIDRLIMVHQNGTNALPKDSFTTTQEEPSVRSSLVIFAYA